MTRLERLLQESKSAYDRGDFGPALKKSCAVLEDEPENTVALFIAGMTMVRGGDYGLALPYFEKAARIEPDRHELWNNVGCCYQERHPERALHAFERALKIKPDHADSLSNMCAVEAALGDHRKAIEWAEKCLNIDPGNPDAVYNSSLSLLQLGRWREAWRRYKGSLGRIKWRKGRNYHIGAETPRWNPHNEGRGHTVVIYGEQGLGDHIIFASMIREALKTGARIIIETNERLEELFRRSFPSATVYGTLGQDECDWPLREGVDRKMEMGGLGEFYAPKPVHFSPYLKADPALRRGWKAAIAEIAPEKLKVGIAWNGGIAETGSGWRNVPFSALKPILDVPGVTFFDMEYRDSRAFQHPSLVNLRMDLRNGNYDDAAALVDALDLVIAPTTAIVDLCGAMGKECWVMCPANPPWRYSPEAGERSMYVYASPEVFRQKERGDWSGVVQEIAGRLAERA